MKARLFFLSSFLLVLPQLVEAQERNRTIPEQDLEFWLSAAVEFKPFKKPDSRLYEKQFFRKFRSAVELGYRSADYLAQSKQVYGIFMASYRFTPFLRLSAEQRYTARDRYSNNTDRTDVMMQLATDIGRIGLTYRLRYQHEWLPQPEVRDLIRNAARAEWNTRKFPIDPYLGAETFQALHFQRSGLVGMRYTAGVKWRASKANSLDLSFRHDREIGTRDPLYRYVISISYEFDWNRR
ncbi:MAG: DUF2490 domain-containing protein [Flavobacteriales bacterium]|nr:DUF2490 domain-containing protein [Flavobacteriales bacterium]